LREIIVPRWFPQEERAFAARLHLYRMAGLENRGKFHRQTFPGQSFESIGRVLVQTTCYDKFCIRLKEKIAKMRVGSAMDHSNDVGATRAGNVAAIKGALELQTHIERFQVRGNV